MQSKDKNDRTNMNKPPPLRCAAMVAYNEGLPAIFNDWLEVWSAKSRKPSNIHCDQN